jgi:hypothetical protein
LDTHERVGVVMQNLNEAMQKQQEAMAQMQQQQQQPK